NSPSGHFGLRGEVQSDKGTARPVQQPGFQSMVLCNGQPIPVVRWKIAQGCVSSSFELLEQLNLIFEMVIGSSPIRRYELVAHTLCHSSVHMMAAGAVSAHMIDKVGQRHDDNRFGGN